MCLPPPDAKRLVGPLSTRRDATIAPVVPPKRYQASNPRSQSSQKCFGSPTSRASRSARVVGGFGTVLPRRVVAVMSSRDCTSRSGLATNGSVAMVLVGKKSTMAARTSSRDQSATSGARPGAALLVDMGLSAVRRPWLAIHQVDAKRPRGCLAARPRTETVAGTSSSRQAATSRRSRGAGQPS